MVRFGTAKAFLMLVVLLPFFFRDHAGAQETATSQTGSSAISESNPQAGTAGTESKADAGETKTAAKSKATREKAPEFPGATTRLLKPGDKIPERVNPDYEDWSRPELTSGMKMEVVSLARGEGDGFTRELVHVQWRDMDPIDLWVVKPKGIAKPPVVIYLYSYPSTDARYKDAKFCNFLTENGFAAVGFVAAVSAQRFHDRPTSEWFVSQLQESLGTTVHDVQMIINYLWGRGDFDLTRIGVWGDGSGASVAIMAAAVDTRIKSIDLLNPWGDWPDWLAKSSLIPDKERPFYQRPDFLRSVEHLDPIQLLPKLSDRQVRLQYILNGLTVTPTIVRERMEAAAPGNVEIVHYNDTQAFISEVASKGAGFDWIKRQLQPMGDIHQASNPGSQDLTKAPPDAKKVER